MATLDAAYRRNIDDHNDAYVRSFPIQSNKVIYAGSFVSMDTGTDKAIPSSDNPGEVFLGIAVQTVGSVSSNNNNIEVSCQLSQLEEREFNVDLFPTDQDSACNTIDDTLLGVGFGGRATVGTIRKITGLRTAIVEILGAINQ